MRHQHDALTRAAGAVVFTSFLMVSAPAAAETRRALSVSAVVVPVCTVSTAARDSIACTHDVGATVSTDSTNRRAERERAGPRVRPVPRVSRPDGGVRYTTISF